MILLLFHFFWLRGQLKQKVVHPLLYPHRPPSVGVDHGLHILRVWFGAASLMAEQPYAGVTVFGAEITCV